MSVLSMVVGLRVTGGGGGCYRCDILNIPVTVAQISHNRIVRYCIIYCIIHIKSNSVF